MVVLQINHLLMMSLFSLLYCLIFCLLLLLLLPALRVVEKEKWKCLLFLCAFSTHATCVHPPSHPFSPGIPSDLKYSLALFSPAFDLSHNNSWTSSLLVPCTPHSLTVSKYPFSQLISSSFSLTSLSLSLSWLATCCFLSPVFLSSFSHFSFLRYKEAREEEEEEEEEPWCSLERVRGRRRRRKKSYFSLKESPN